MDYDYLDDYATADIAFTAKGTDLAGMFGAAADATINVMVEEIDAIEERQSRPIELRNEEIDLLLFDFLQELIYYKDAEQLLLRMKDIRITEEDGQYLLKAVGRGEKLDPERHEQRADVKAVTLHNFRVEKQENGWKALVILDV